MSNHYRHLIADPMQPSRFPGTMGHHETQWGGPVAGPEGAIQPRPELAPLLERKSFAATMYVSKNRPVANSAHNRSRRKKKAIGEEEGKNIAPPNPSAGKERELGELPARIS